MCAAGEGTVGMLQGNRRRVSGTVRVTLPLAWVLGVLSWELFVPTGVHIPQLLSASPAIACAATGRRGAVLAGGALALVALVLLSVATQHVYPGPGTTVGAFGALLTTVVAGYLAAGRGVRLQGDLKRAREVATAAQRAVVQPLPPRLGGLALAGGYLSSTRGAAVGGDLYGAVAGPHGVRIVIGDVRGHGLAAIRTVTEALGVFREAGHDEPCLEGVLRRLERGFARGRDPGPEGAEEFLTVLLVEIGSDGAASFLNCGHPWPHRLSPPGARCAEAVQVTEAEPLPPLGLFPLPARLPEPLRVRLAQGEGLFLCTDGASDARDARGVFFPLEEALHGAVARTDPDPGAAVAWVRDALLRHTGGHLADDVALLVLRQEQCPAGRRSREPEAHAFG